MKYLLSIFLLIFSLFPAQAANETSINFGLSAGNEPRTLCAFDTTHTCVAIGSLDSVAHTFAPASAVGSLIAGINIWSGYNTFTNGIKIAGTVQEPTGLRQVATRSYIPTLLMSNQQCMARTMHVARDSITSLQTAYASWIGKASNGEQNTPQNLTIYASVEYPAGTFTQFKWGGSTFSTQLPGANYLSDALAVSIPKNATFWMRAYITTSTGTSGMPFTGSGDANAGPVYPAGGDALNCGASVSNLTMSGTVTDNQSNQAAIYPVALVAQTSTRSVIIYGDSIAWGYRDSPMQGGDTGVIAHSIGPYMPYINASVFGDSVNGLANGYAKRQALSAYATDVIVQTGINDISVGYSENTVKANLRTIWGLFPGKPVYQATYLPYTTSTDSFATVANQTQFANDNIRQDINDYFRMVPDANLAGVVELADQVENYRGGGKWAVLGQQCTGYCQYTYDGLHPNIVANIFIARTGAVLTALQAGRFK